MTMKENLCRERWFTKLFRRSPAISITTHQQTKQIAFVDKYRLQSSFSTFENRSQKILSTSVIPLALPFKQTLQSDLLKVLFISRKFNSAFSTRKKITTVGIHVGYF